MYTLDLTTNLFASTTCVVTLARLKMWNKATFLWSVIHNTPCSVCCCEANGCTAWEQNKREETAKSCTAAKQGREPGACCMNGEEKQLHHEKKLPLLPPRAVGSHTLSDHRTITHSLALLNYIPSPSLHLQVHLFILLCCVILLAPFICCNPSSLSLPHFPHPSICFSLSLLLIYFLPFSHPPPSLPPCSLFIHMSLCSTTAPMALRISTSLLVSL